MQPIRQTTVPGDDRGRRMRCLRRSRNGGRDRPAAQQCVRHWPRHWAETPLSAPYATIHRRRTGCVRHRGQAEHGAVNLNHADRDRSGVGASAAAPKLPSRSRGMPIRSLPVSYFQSFEPVNSAATELKKCHGVGGNGAQGRNRTIDTAIFSRMLYQLSYLGAGGAQARSLPPHAFQAGGLQARGRQSPPSRARTASCSSSTSSSVGPGTRYWPVSQRPRSTSAQRGPQKGSCSPDAALPQIGQGGAARLARPGEAASSVKSRPR